MARLSSTTMLLAVAASATTACSTPSRGGAATETMRFVEGRAGRLRVSDGGGGPTAGDPVVFVHGLGHDLGAWREQLDHLRPARRAVAYDQRGHGGSDRPRDGVYTVAALADDLGAVVDALGLRRFVLVGHSLSGTVLTAYAGAHPERVSGLVYADAVGDLHTVPPAALEQQFRQDEALRPDQVVAAFADMLGPPTRPATREAVLVAVRRFDPAAFAALRRSAFQFAVGDRLSAFRGPVVAIEAEGPADAYRASAVVPGARRVELAGVGHWLQLDDPPAFDRALDAFLGLPGR